MTSRVRTSELEVRCDSVCPAPLLPDEVGELYSLLIADVREYAILMLDTAGLVVSWNAGAEIIKGYQADEIVGRHFSVFYPADDVAAGVPAQNLAEAARDGRVEYEGWRVRKDGSRFWADVVITAMIGDDGVLRGFGKVTRNLTERRAADQALRESEQRFRLLIADVREYAILMLDTTGLVVTWNAGAESIKGYQADEIVGRHFSVFYPADDVAAGVPAQNLAEAARDGRVEYEGWRVRKDGSRFWADVVITAMIGDDGVLRGFGKVTRDLTERHATEQEHHHRSLHDALTGLPNRALLGDRLDQALGRLERHAGSVAVLFIDLNDFKGINDTYGHDSGDAVLVDVAQRLLTAVRPEDTVARIGGDEFVAVCGDVTGPPAGRAIADRVIAAFGSPMSWAADELAVSASIGIALTARPDISAPVMLRRADKAMYEAKRLGRATSHAHLVSDDEGA